jgi:hypothetical protein
MSTVAKGSVMNTCDVIWENIKDREINMFSLPGQKVSDYCEVQSVEPTKLYLKTRVSAFLPALDDLLSKEYTVEMHDKFIVVAVK